MVSLGTVSLETDSLGTISLGLFFWLRHEGGCFRSDESSVPKEFAAVYFNNVGPLVPSGMIVASMDHLDVFGS